MTNQDFVVAMAPGALCDNGSDGVPNSQTKFQQRPTNGFVRIASMRIGRESLGAPFFMDDVGCSDTSGTEQVSWLGPGRIVLMTPASDTGTVQWTRGGSSPASTHWDGINDEATGSSDDAVTFNSDTGNSNMDRMGLSNFSPASAMLIWAQFTFRISTAASNTIALRWWDDGGTATTCTAVGGISFSYGSYNASTRCSASLRGKSIAQLNSYNVGYVGATGTGTKQVTSLWVEVEYIVPSGVITRSNGCATAGSNCAMSPTTNLVGDGYLGFAYRTGSTTPPTVPTGWTAIASGSVGTTAYAVACKYATTTIESSGTWTNATDLLVVGYHNVNGSATGQSCDRQMFSSYPGINNSSSSSSSISYGGTPMSGDGTSWIVAFGAHASANNVQLPPTGLSNVLAAGAGPMAAAFDSAGGRTSWPTSSVTVNATSAYRSYVFELLPETCSNTAYGVFRCVQHCSGLGLSATSQSCTFPSNVTAGDALVVQVSHNATTTGTINVSGCGVNWMTDPTLALSSISATQSTGTVASTGGCTLTASTTGGAGDLAVTGYEWSGWNGTFDSRGTITSYAAPGANTPFNCPTVTTTVNGDLVICTLAANENRTQWTLGTGYQETGYWNLFPQVLDVGPRRLLGDHHGHKLRAYAGNKHGCVQRIDRKSHELECDFDSYGGADGSHKRQRGGHSRRGGVQCSHLHSNAPSSQHNESVTHVGNGGHVGEYHGDELRGDTGEQHCEVQWDDSHPHKLGYGFNLDSGSYRSDHWECHRHGERHIEQRNEFHGNGAGHNTDLDLRKPSACICCCWKRATLHRDRDV
jgi:hypothetical protein